LANSAEVTLVDRHNFQTFLPLLYQVATAGLAADHVAYPIRGALRKSEIAFRMGSPISVDHRNKEIKLDSSEVLPFDHLIVALGSATADFGIKGVTEYALGMKSVSEAINIRAEVMRRFEDLCRFHDETRLSISVVGGGPTGVEMADALAELVRGPLTSDQEQAAKHIDIYLIEAGPRLLPSFSPSLSARTQKDLETLGVKVLTNAAVQEITPRKILLKSGENIPAEVTIWAAGVKGEPLAQKLSLPIVATRIEIEPTLQVKNYPHIWAIGDIAGAKGRDGRYLPMIAPVAMQQGTFVARQIERVWQGKELLSFAYKNKGSMATIGRHKVLTMADWMWNYLTFDRGNRHIMDSQ